MNKQHFNYTIETSSTVICSKTQYKQCGLKLEDKLLGIEPPGIGNLL